MRVYKYADIVYLLSLMLAHDACATPADISLFTPAARAHIDAMLRVRLTPISLQEVASRYARARGAMSAMPSAAAGAATCLPPRDKHAPMSARVTTVCRLLPFLLKDIRRYADAMSCRREPPSSKMSHYYMMLPSFG